MNGLVDTLLNYTALPNLHPAVVHFPIALFPLAVAFDLVVVLGRRHALDRVTAVLYALAALSAGAAVWSGERASETLGGYTEAVRIQVHGHEEWAEWFFYAAMAVALVRIGLSWWQERRVGGERLGGVAVRALVLVASLAACTLLVGVADRGGSLVYRSGVAVMAVEAPEPAPDGGDR